MRVAKLCYEALLLNRDRAMLSHILKVMRDQALGLVHMNPGACGHKGGTSSEPCCDLPWKAGRYRACRQSNWGLRGRWEIVGNRRAPLT
jgi:hypothetical protein